MRFTNKFPYTNLNYVNLDWIIKRVKELGETVRSYAQDIANAVSLAEAAQEAADSVTSTAESAVATAQAAEATANAIADTANNALSTAQAAETTANAIAGTANNALSTAQAAESTAQAAENTAHAAENTAHAAEESANIAVSVAGTANANASNAVQAANTALATAEAALVLASQVDVEALNEKAGKIVDTETGAVVSFIPDRTIEQNLSVSVAVEPVQDLHGYDSPWPAGGGKNKLNVSSGTGTEMRGVNVTYDNAGGLVYSGTPTAGGFAGNWTLSPALTLPAGRYTFSIGGTIAQRIDLLAGWGSVGFISANNASNTFTLSESKSIDKIVLSVIDAGEQINVNVKNIQIESGSAATAYAPYENLCPISGWDAVAVQRTGKNLIGDFNIVDGEGYNSTGQVETNPNRFRTQKIVCAGQSKITLGWTKTQETTVQAIRVIWDKYGNLLNRTIPSATISGNRFQYTTNLGTFPGAYFIAFAFYADGGARAQDNCSDIMCEFSDAPSPYTPATGNTYTITLGQTVYGGTLDAVNGTMTVDRAFIQSSDTLFYARNNATSYYLRGDRIPLAKQVSSSEASVLSNRYKSLISTTAPACWLNPGGNIRFTTATEYASVADMVAGEGTIQFVYPLQNPIEIQLDPVTIAAIAGQTNNVWADAGNITVEFAADLKWYIDKEIAELQALVLENGG